MHHFTNFVLAFVILPCFIVPMAQGEAKQLAVEHGPTGKPYLTYGGSPLFAFGPGDEYRILGGAADLERWAVKPPILVPVVMRDSWLLG